MYNKSINTDQLNNLRKHITQLFYLACALDAYFEGAVIAHTRLVEIQKIRIPMASSFVHSVPIALGC